MEMIGLIFLLAIIILSLDVLVLGADETRGSLMPMHNGRISPLLYGNFIEPLNDLLPGMSAEKLNDRKFETISCQYPYALGNRFYDDGQPDICDVAWEPNETWTYDNEHPLNGQYCARMNAKSSAPAILRQPHVALQKDMNYTFSVYLRTNCDDISVNIQVKTKLPDGKWMILLGGRFSNLSSYWTRYSFEAASLGNTDKGVIEISTEGNGALWLDSVSLMPEDNIETWRADVVEAIRRLQPSIIRWGGAAMDPAVYGQPEGRHYEWKKALGDRDLRDSYPNWCWGRMDSNDIGIDEFLQFCEQVGAEPLICLSLGDGLDSAGHLIEYCNGSADTEWGAKRSQNGHTEPYGVKYWQVGNEWPPDDTYLKTYPDFCRRLRSVSPNIKIMSSWPSERMLKGDVADLIDYMSPHYYTADLDFIDEKLTHWRGKISENPSASHIKLAVTEWNITAEDWGLDRLRVCSLAGGLKNARTLNTYHRHCDILEIACRSNMVNCYGAGVLRTNRAELVKMPAYYVMQLYSQHTRPVPIKVSTVPEGLDVSLCASEDLQTLTLFVVNFTPQDKIIKQNLADFGLDLVPVLGRVVCDTLKRRQPDISNWFACPDRVRTVALNIDKDEITLPAYSVAALEATRVAK